MYVQEPMKSRAPQLHLEYRFYKQLGQAGEMRHRLYEVNKYEFNCMSRFNFVVSSYYIDTSNLDYPNSSVLLVGF